jgi:pilus assembly protein CpaB
MRIATITSLGASAALGLGALFVARFWLPQQTSAAVIHPPAPAPGVPVVVAATPISYGQKLEAKNLTLARLPVDAVPPGAYGSVDQVLKLDSGGAPVALIAISPREPLLPAKLSGAGAKPTLAAMIGQGMRAYTIGVTDVAGGGGHVMPGDRVDVVLTRDLSNGQPAMEGHGGPGGKLVSDIVIQNVRVLGMDLNIDPSSTHPATAHTATLEVDVRDAERLALAAQAGTLSLALRRTGSADISQVRPVASADLGPSGAADPGAIRIRRGRGGTAAPAAPAGATVLVRDGDKSAAVTVPSERRGAGV